MFVIPRITQQLHAISIKDRLLWPFGVAPSSNNHSRLHVTFPTFLPDLNHVRNFATGFRKSALRSNFTEIGPVRAADRLEEANMLFTRLCKDRVFDGCTSQSVFINAASCILLSCHNTAAQTVGGKVQEQH